MARRTRHPSTLPYSSPATAVPVASAPSQHIFLASTRAVKIGEGLHPSLLTRTGSRVGYQGPGEGSGEGEGSGGTIAAHSGISSGPQWQFGLPEHPKGSEKAPDSQKFSNWGPLAKHEQGGGPWPSPLPLPGGGPAPTTKVFIPEEPVSSVILIPFHIHIAPFQPSPNESVMNSSQTEPGGTGMLTG